MAWELPANLIENNGLLLGLAKWVNSVTYNLFWPIMLFMFCIVLYVATARLTNDRSFGYAAIAGLFGSIILMTLKLMSWYIGSMFIIAGILGIVFMIIRKY